MTEAASNHEQASPPAGIGAEMLARESLIESLGLPPGVEDAVLDILRPRDLGRAAEFK